MNYIIWPEGYIPGESHNFASNEIIVKGITAEEVWEYLFDTSAWPTYYANASDIHFYNESGPRLTENSRFKFTTFGFLVEAQIKEFVAPINGNTGRIAWHGWVEGNENERLDVHHAWLIENLEGNRVRILTQETQNGKPAKDMALTKPNPMINAHQDWLEGLAKITLDSKK